MKHAPWGDMTREERDEIIVAILTGTISSVIGSLVYRVVVPAESGATLADKLPQAIQAVTA